MGIRYYYVDIGIIAIVLSYEPYKSFICWFDKNACLKFNGMRMLKLCTFFDGLHKLS